jgi:hypothetical protein
MTSIIKVDNLQNQCGANIINENAGTITIGASGDTVTLAAGASQSGFGRSGSVNWDTTPKTTGFTAVSGNGYFCDTTSAAFTVTLPATPAAGDIVAIADYANTAATNNITVGRNSVNIDGNPSDATILINGQVYTLVYVDATEGWKTVGQTFNQISTAQFVAATGGTIITCGDYKIHSFTGPGTFTVSNAGNPFGSDTVDYLVVAGGGGGNGSGGGGGGGGGGFRMAPALPVSAQGYPITVGGGGVGASPPATTGTQGSNTIFSTITSTGGGGGSQTTGAAGGSGGGGGGCNGTFPGGAGNTPPVSPPQGNAGGIGGSPGAGRSGGGGGGAGAVGQDSNVPAPVPTRYTGRGGAGSPATPIFGGPPQPFYGTDSPSNDYGQVSTGFFAGGGGGGATPDVTTAPPLGALGPKGASQGGAGGGGQGTNSGCTQGSNGKANSGGGGGGTHGGPGTRLGGSGGSGIVIIRYKFQ